METERTIKRYKNDTPGETKINKAILKNIPERAIKMQQTIFNHTLSLDYFPPKFKTAIIKLIPKPKSDTTNPNNYRPISLLAIPGKILEKIINQQLREFLDQNNILNDRQHGFRAKRGTGTALIVILETLAHHIARRAQCYVVLRDVSKAFDKVWHTSLQFKLSHLNLPQCITKFICNFILNREAKIKVRDYIRTPFQLSAGVPQGSSLSPTLYTVYTNDLLQDRAGCTTIIRRRYNPNDHLQREIKEHDGNKDSQRDREDQSF